MVVQRKEAKQKRRSPSAAQVRDDFTEATENHAGSLATALFWLSSDAQ